MFEVIKIVCTCYVFSVLVVLAICIIVGVYDWLKGNR